MRQKIEELKTEGRFETMPPGEIRDAAEEIVYGDLTPEKIKAEQQQLAAFEEQFDRIIFLNRADALWLNPNDSGELIIRDQDDPDLSSRLDPIVLTEEDYEYVETYNQAMASLKGVEKVQDTPFKNNPEAAKQLYHTRIQEVLDFYDGQPEKKVNFLAMEFQQSVERFSEDDLTKYDGPDFQDRARILIAEYRRAQEAALSQGRSVPEMEVDLDVDMEHQHDAPGKT